jgi:hypothetical protein
MERLDDQLVACHSLRRQGRGLAAAARQVAEETRDAINLYR